jgi:hypothetical protein
MRDKANCRRYRELLGARLLGDLEPEENAELEDHLARCPECRAEEEELRSVAELLGEPGTLPEEGLDPPPDLREKVVRGAVGGTRRSSPAIAAAAALLVVMIGVAALFALGLPNPDEAPGLGDQEPISFGSPPQGVAVADASVVAHTWGTEVFIEVSGLEEGEVYEIEVEKEDGSLVSAGTMIGVGENEIDCVLNAAVLRQNASAVVITDSKDEPVLRSELERRPASLYT